MRKYLTIGELADFLNVNTSTIRYYEREGIMFPSKIDENKYRLYDFDKLDRMQNILLLRDLDIPLKDLKELLEDYSLEKYNCILRNSLSNIENKIETLKSKKQAISRKLGYTENFKVVEPEFKYNYHKARILLQIHSGELLEFSIKEMYEVMKEKSWFDYLKVDVSYMILEDKNMVMYCVDEELFPDAENICNTVTLNAGKYLEYGFFIEIDKDLLENIDIIEAEDKFINEATDKFNHYLEDNSLKKLSQIIYKQNIRSSHFELYSFHITIECLIESS